jgi:hypothetical protein
MKQDDIPDIEAMQEAREQNREDLFTNESFAIGAVLAVSAVVAFSLLNQIALLTGGGAWAILLALTAALSALGCSALAALFRHEYKKWQVKSMLVREPGEHRRRARLAKIFRKWMRRLMQAATALLVVGLVVLVIGVWARLISA